RKLLELLRRLQNADLVPSYPHSMTTTNSLGRLLLVRDVSDQRGDGDDSFEQREGSSRALFL
ncbi:MAG: hypothetical protein WAM64_09035, partial [Acidimicrobiales bacterium]